MINRERKEMKSPRPPKSSSSPQINFEKGLASIISNYVMTRVSLGVIYDKTEETFRRNTVIGARAASYYEPGYTATNIHRFSWAMQETYRDVKNTLPPTSSIYIKGTMKTKGGKSYEKIFPLNAVHSGIHLGGGMSFKAKTIFELDFKGDDGKKKKLEITHHDSLRSSYTLSLSSRSNERSSERSMRANEKFSTKIKNPKPKGHVSAFKMNSKDSIEKLEILVDESMTLSKKRERRIKKAIQQAYSKFTRSSNQ